ncbi:uncharacterized protein LOC117571285 [Drosophila albomicans]|uniref:Uncharacterized protein LOC117571285 n=1 Tax=Drosophila albomicans TaxID=7291 RepID=A0A6P8YUD6_DROAB|nr:uncharacterized protein LOC117571285 [Drosophila albomicans]
MRVINKRLTVQYLQRSEECLNPLGQSSLFMSSRRVHQDHEGLEASVLKELLNLDEALRDYFKEWLSELSLQRMAAEKLLKLSKDYMVKTEMSCSAPKFPIADTDAIVNKYQVHYQIILSSNSAMHRGLNALRKFLLAFRRESRKLDLSSETPFVLGDMFHKPIKFFMDLAEELFGYFHCSYLKLDCGSRHLDPADLMAVENYQKILAPCEEFDEYLQHNLGYCQCLRPVQPCPPVPRQTPPKTNGLEQLMVLAQQRRCARRVSKMTAKTEEVMEATPSKQESVELNLEHELRMNQLSMRLAMLRQSRGNFQTGYDRDIVEQMIYALSPSLMPDTYLPPQSRAAPTLSSPPAL